MKPVPIHLMNVPLLKIILCPAKSLYQFQLG